MKKRSIIIFTVLIGTGLIGIKQLFFMGAAPLDGMAVQKYSPEPVARSDDFGAFERPQLASQQFKKPEPHQIPLKNLGSKEIKDAIAQLEAQLEDGHAIERLNQDSLSLEERAAVGKQLKELDRLREKNLALRLAEIASDVAELEKNHAARLQTYGVMTR